MPDMQIDSINPEGVQKKRFHLTLYISIIILSLCFAWFFMPQWFASRLKTSIRNQLSTQSVTTVQVGNIHSTWHGSMIDHLYIEVDDMQITLKNVQLINEKDLVWKKISSAIVESMDIKGGSLLTFNRTIKDFFMSINILPTVQHMKINGASIVFPDHDILLTFSGDGVRLDETEFTLNLNWKSSNQTDLKATSKLHVSKKMFNHTLKGENLTLYSAIGSYVLPEFTFTQNCSSDNSTITYQSKSKLKSPHLATIFDTELAINVRDLQAEGSLKFSENGNHVALIKGTLNTTFMGEVAVDVTPLDADFFKDIITKYVPVLEKTTGKIGATGTISLKGPETIDSKLTIKIDKGACTIGQFKIEGANGAVSLKSFIPLETEQTQELNIAKLKRDSIELQDVTLLFGCDQGKFLPKNVNGKLFGGVVSLFEFYVAPTQELQFSLKARGLFLDEMMKLSVFSGVSGNGLLSGEANCALTDKDLILLQGNFKLTNSQSKLKFSVSNASKPKMEVLKDLTTSILTIRLLPTETATPGVMNASVYLLGYNPEIQNGYPFEYEIETAGTLPEIIQKTIEKIRSSS